MKIVFFGTPQEVVPVLDNLIQHFAVSTVVTAPDQKSGRKQIVTPAPVKVFAKSLKIPVFAPHILNDEVKKQLESIKPDLFIVAAYGKIIPQDILALPKHGAINIHPSLLPKYRGPTPIQTALLNGDRTSGITFMIMDEKMDHGPILQQIPITFEKNDTFDWLMENEFKQAALLLPDVIKSYISGKTPPQPQDDSLATYTKMIAKENGKIDLQNPPEPDLLDRMIRAYYPWPTVWSTLPFVDNKNTTRIIKFLPENKLQVEGKNPVSVKDFLNGYPHMKELLKKLGLD